MIVVANEVSLLPISICVEAIKRLPVPVLIYNVDNTK